MLLVLHYILRLVPLVGQVNLPATLLPHHVRLQYALGLHELYYLHYTLERDADYNDLLDMCSSRGSLG